MPKRETSLDSGKRLGMTKADPHDSPTGILQHPAIATTHYTTTTSSSGDESLLDSTGSMQDESSLSCDSDSESSSSSGDDDQSLLELLAKHNPRVNVDIAQIRLVVDSSDGDDDDDDSDDDSSDNSMLFTTTDDDDDDDASHSSIRASVQKELLDMSRRSLESGRTLSTHGTLSVSSSSLPSIGTNRPAPGRSHSGRSLRSSTSGRSLGSRRSRRKDCPNHSSPRRRLKDESQNHNGANNNSSSSSSHADTAVSNPDNIHDVDCKPLAAVDATPKVLNAQQTMGTSSPDRTTTRTRRSHSMPRLTSCGVSSSSGSEWYSTSESEEADSSSDDGGMDSSLDVHDTGFDSAPPRRSIRKCHTAACSSDAASILQRMASCSQSYRQDPDFSKTVTPQGSLSKLVDSVSSLPGLWLDDTTNTSMEETPALDPKSPAACLANLLEGIRVVDLSEVYWKDYFREPISKERTRNYVPQVVSAMRASDTKELRRLHLAGHSMDACNGQGESLVHLACRRQDNPELLKFLIQEAGDGDLLKVRDDWGKTPLHELAWKRSGTTTSAKQSTSNSTRQFDAVKLVLQHAPELLLVQDKRGFQALQYVPKDAWEDWCQFLRRYKVLIRYQIQYIAYSQAERDLQESMDTATTLLQETQKKQDQR